MLATLLLQSLPVLHDDIYGLIDDRLGDMLM